MAATPVKPLQEHTCQSPVMNSHIYIELPNKVLRKLNNFKNSDLIESINAESHEVKLKCSERLVSRLQKEVNRASNEYKKIRNGYKKTLFDTKIRKIAVYLDEISTTSVLQNNSSVRVDNSSKSSKKRLIEKLEENVGKSLDFVGSFGVLPKKLVCESFDGKESVLHLDGRKNKNVSYEYLTSIQKEEVKKMVEICDRTMMSDGVYHELSMQLPSMPRTHHLVECRKDINSSMETKRTPGMLPGSYISLTDELKTYVLQQKEKGYPVENLRIKISGDGTRVSRVSNFVVVSYSLIDDKENNHLSQKVIAIVNCDEKYENLKTSLAPILTEINELNDKKEFCVGDVSVGVEVFIGGDMKFIQLLLGLNGSTSTYACPWCKVAKDNRSDMSYGYYHYHNQTNSRNIAEMTSLSHSSKPKDSYGSKNHPLLLIDPNHYIPDELHLLLRIGGVLLRNLIDDACSKDQYAKIMNEPTDNLKLLVQAINACGVNFQVWTNKTGDLDYTSLTGNGMKKVLSSLPEKMLFCIHEETREMIIKLWQDFMDIYGQITTSGETVNSTEIFEKARNFIENFLAIGKKNRVGYLPKNVTPYMHVLVYHVPVFLQQYGSSRKFSGQSVEKTNDIVKKIHHCKTNKWDATSDALIVRKRMEMSSGRIKRKYEIVDEQQFIAHKSQICKNRKLQIQSEIEMANKENTKPCGIETMTVDEIKEKLKSLGVKTKLRKREKLEALLMTLL